MCALPKRLKMFLLNMNYARSQRGHCVTFQTFFYFFFKSFKILKDFKSSCHFVCFRCHISHVSLNVFICAYSESEI